MAVCVCDFSMFVNAPTIRGFLVQGNVLQKEVILNSMFSLFCCFPLLEKEEYQSLLSSRIKLIPNFVNLLSLDKLIFSGGFLAAAKNKLTKKLRKSSKEENSILL